MRGALAGPRAPRAAGAAALARTVRTASLSCPDRRSSPNDGEGRPARAPCWSQKRAPVPSTVPTGRTRGFCPFEPRTGAKTANATVSADTRRARGPSMLSPTSGSVVVEPSTPTRHGWGAGPRRQRGREQRRRLRSVVVASGLPAYRPPAALAMLECFCSNRPGRGPIGGGARRYRSSDRIARRSASRNGVRRGNATACDLPLDRPMQATVPRVPYGPVRW
ncbi:hypothetical protein HRbin40_01043 [bacterium HR40]|nr:hypothetical protein HRbin40_01043 [bacterium HR40]